MPSILSDRRFSHYNRLRPGCKALEHRQNKTFFAVEFGQISGYHGGRGGKQMNVVDNVNCELLRRLLAAAWEKHELQRVEVLSLALDDLTVHHLQGEQAKTM
jgi:hypothetical protein